jgi:hypothetical protein
LIDCERPAPERQEFPKKANAGAPAVAQDRGCLRLILSAVFMLLTAIKAIAEPFAEPPKQYSIVEVVNPTKACRPAFSGTCIELKKGERVVVLAWQIDNNPHRGLYCLRPIGMSECYYADLTTIEINGVPASTIGMDNPSAEKPITREDAVAPPIAHSQEFPQQQPPRLIARCIVVPGCPTLDLNTPSARSASLSSRARSRLLASSSTTRAGSR